jgi:hypothetical protein
MSARFQHPSASKDAPAIECVPGRLAGPAADPADTAGHACCCAAKAVVRVTMPPVPSRPHSTELLLCAHHYRVSRHALASARAVVRELPGTPRDVASWVGIEPDSAPTLVR